MKIKVGAYFYPITTTCPVRNRRAKHYGYPSPVDEISLAANSQPLYDGHDQPKVYSLGGPERTRWDDANIDDMDRQIALASRYGVDHFIFDTYIGVQHGRIKKESIKPLDEAFVEASKNHPDFKFAIMSCLDGPRTHLPVKLDEPSVEKARRYSYGEKTAEAVVDHCAKYWESDNYLRVDGKPYISLWLPIQKNRDIDRAADYIGLFREKAEAKVGEVYLVGVSMHAACLDAFVAGGVNAITEYSNLPALSGEPVYEYRDRVNTVCSNWGNHYPWPRKISPNPFTWHKYLPSVAVGWDGSPRGENGHSLEDVGMTYPFVPIVENPNARDFLTMLFEAQTHLEMSDVTDDERLINLMSWNEVSEGAALLPRIKNGRADTEFLDALRYFKNAC